MTPVSRAQLRHDADRRRYEYVDRTGEALALVEYRAEGDTVTLHHTFTEPARRGHGYAARVVQFALDDLRARGKRIVPQCWFVAEFVADHPEYRDLVADQ